VTLVERQTTLINEAKARSLLADPSFRLLLDAGIVELTRSKGSFVLVTGHFVGKARLADGSEFIVAEKASGALAGMLPWASPNDVRDILLETDASSDGILLSLLIERFLASVAVYIGRIRKAYHVKRVELLSPRGRIDIRATARLRARAMRTRVSCAQAALTTNIPSNALIALALLSLEAWSSLPGIDPTSIERARALLAFFSDCDFYKLRQLSWRIRALLFEKELSSPFRSNELAMALSYGRPIALHAVMSLGQEYVSNVPASLFVNLESLYEDAVLNCLKSAHGQKQVLRPTEIQRRSVLVETCEQYKASPDAIINLDAANTIILDCKYKVHEGWPAHSDMYQLMAHAQAYNAKRAMLVYPGNVFSIRRIGSTRGEVIIDCATVRCANLREDVAALLEHYVMLPEPVSTLLIEHQEMTLL